MSATVGHLCGEACQAPPPGKALRAISITLNGERHSLAAPSTLAELLTALDQTPDTVATAVNGEFVARTARADHLLHDGDAVFTFQPITGG